MTNKPESYEEKIKQVAEHNTSFESNFAYAIKKYKESHGQNARIPVTKDKDGRYHWVNRRQRRKMMKQQKRKRRLRKQEESR